MKEYQHTHPNATEIPFGFTEADGVHEQTEYDAAGRREAA